MKNKTLYWIIGIVVATILFSWLISRNKKGNSTNSSQNNVGEKAGAGKICCKVVTQTDINRLGSTIDCTQTVVVPKEKPCPAGYSE